VSELLAKYKMKVITQNMIGLPTETYEQTLETLKVNMKVKPTIASCSYFTPFPGMPLLKYYDNLELQSGYFYKPCNKDRRIENLRCFFSLIAKHPFLFKLRWILNLPPNPLFKFLGNLIDGYYLGKCLPYKTKSILKNAVVFFFRYRR